MNQANVFMYGATSAMVITAPDIYVFENALWVDYQNDEEECLCYPLTSIKYFRIATCKVNSNDKT